MTKGKITSKPNHAPSTTVWKVKPNGPTFDSAEILKAIIVDTLAIFEKAKNYEYQIDETKGQKESFRLAVEAEFIKIVKAHMTYIAADWKVVILPSEPNGDTWDTPTDSYFAYPLYKGKVPYGVLGNEPSGKVTFMGIGSKQIPGPVV